MTDDAAFHPVDRFEAARAVADATLYEGYVLYPYRASAVKNQMRWQFGVLAPPRWVEAGGAERCSLGTECLVDPGRSPQLTVRIRFLQIQRRTIAASSDSGFAPVDALVAGSTDWVPWDEAVERVVDLPIVPLTRLEEAHREVPFAFEAGVSFEAITDPAGEVIGRAERRWDDVAGEATVDAVATSGPERYVKVSVTLRNTSDWSGDSAARDDALARSLIGVHTLLAVDDGMFVSLLDPPANVGLVAAQCHNDGSFPVLVADPFGGPDVVLSSPIILYDHPEVAPESPGDLYDSTEIDEILALRVLTLTESEKAEARGTDIRSAAIVDRCDGLAPEVWERLHGTMRAVPAGVSPEPEPAPAATEALAPADEPRPWWDPGVDAEVDPWSDTTLVGATRVAKGSKVVLRPSRRSDAHDLFLDGMAATVAGVFQDVDGTEQVAVTVDDDPATEVLSWQGRYLFFFPDELEVARPRVLVAGIGNIFFGDDAFGVEVVARLLRRPVPEGVTVADYGIRGLHLAHELLDGYDVLVLVDAVPSGEAPGTVSLMEVDTAPDGTPDSNDEPGLDAHSMNPDVVLASLSRLGGSVGRVLVVGCEPQSCAPTMGLSDEVDAAVGLGVDMVDRLLADLLDHTEQSEDTP